MNLLTSLELAVAPQTLANADGMEFGLGRAGRERRLIVLGVAGAPLPAAFEGEAGEHEGRPLLVCPLSPRNAAALRARLPWLRPRLLGRHKSAGFGDRLGLATPGHIRSLRAVGGGIAAIFAQQSIREMTRTGRSPQQVVDDAMWGAFAEGWRDGFGADADHLKQASDGDACLAAGFTFFTIDPGDHVETNAETMNDEQLEAAFARLPWEALEDSPAACRHRLGGHAFDAEDFLIELDPHTVTVAAVKYGGAVAHTVGMYRHLLAAASDRFELEVSLDETDTPTSHAEHVYVASELQRLGVKWVSLAPRFVGRFEKGVDYIGDVQAFRKDIAVHAAIARTLGGYKLSLHSGSDKFSLYHAAAAETHGVVHLKTAGTSYLEALRTVAAADPQFFRDIYALARERYEHDRASYYVSASLEAAPLPGAVATENLPGLLENFDARQILHVTFGSVLTAAGAPGQPSFGDRLRALLVEHAEAYAENLERHFKRHLEPFAR